MNIFKLPDLGEGLTEAELVEWHVKIGEEVKEDQPLLAVETAKAIVDIPSPYNGRIHHLYGKPGEIIHIHDPLVEFGEGSPVAEASQRNEAQTADRGTVVGQMRSSQDIIREHVATTSTPHTGGCFKVTPAVRALAHRLNVDLAIVTPSGPDGTITITDIQRVAKILAEVGPLEPLRGVRRVMARTMAQAHAEVVAVTLCEDADIHAWPAGTDTNMRLIRALVAGCKAEPALNTWYDSHALGRRVLPKIELGIAVDTPEGLFVPVLRDVGNRTPEDLRKGLDKLREAVKNRSIPPEEMRGNTITLSNFGTFCGRYADPVVVPPTVAILGAGRARPEVVAYQGQPAIHNIMPLSLTFDHRAVTGGEAARYLKAVMEDLEMAG
jgi:2-oxoisovalerate dehydrogenase E2 component (dihydrolipoyl transacylase)